MELFDLPLYAVQRLADGTWLVRSPMGDPLWPAVDVVAVIESTRKQARRRARRVLSNRTRLRAKLGHKIATCPVPLQ